MPDAAVAVRSSEATSGGTAQQVDVAVVGAGFAGLYALHRLRKAGFSQNGLINRSEISGPGGKPVEIDHTVDHSARILDVCRKIASSA
jgi:predicted NAD/FAD-dependent oxidoreductase